MLGHSIGNVQPKPHCGQHRHKMVKHWMQHFEIYSNKFQAVLLSRRVSNLGVVQLQEITQEGTLHSRTPHMLSIDTHCQRNCDTKIFFLLEAYWHLTVLEGQTDTKRLSQTQPRDRKRGLQ